MPGITRMATESGQTISHTYQTAGTYTVGLTVANTQGQTAVATTTASASSGQTIVCIQAFSGVTGLPITGTVINTSEAEQSEPVFCD